MSSVAQSASPPEDRPGAAKSSHAAAAEERARFRRRLVSWLGLLVVVVVAAVFGAWIATPIDWGADLPERGVEVADGVGVPKVLMGAAKILSMDPEEETVTVERGTPQWFSVVLDGIDPQHPPRMRWVLEGEVVAEGTTLWEYDPEVRRPTPGTPGMLQFLLGTGRSEGQRRTWWIEATGGPNLSPVLLDASHKPGSTIVARVGESIEISVDAYDPDGDPLDFAWRIDGRPAERNAPVIAIPVRGNHLVSLAISDGDATVWSTWKIEASPVPDA